MSSLTWSGFSVESFRSTTIVATSVSARVFLQCFSDSGCKIVTEATVIPRLSLIPFLDTCFELVSAIVMLSVDKNLDGVGSTFIDSKFIGNFNFNCSGHYPVYRAKTLPLLPAMLLW